VSAFLAEAASAAYILGFLALFIPIAATHASTTLITALYATTLASKNLLIVLGVTQLLLPSISFWLSYELAVLFAAFGIWLFSWGRLEDRMRRFRSHLELAKLVQWIIPTTALTGWFTAFIFPFFNRVPFINWDEIVAQLINRPLFRMGLFFIIISVMVLVIGWGLFNEEPPVSYSDFEGDQRLSQVWRNQIRRRYLERPRQALRTAMLYLIIFFFLALSASCLLTPNAPLPWVEMMTTKDSAKDYPDEGWLVAHSDGYWHVFNKEGVLVAIPDDKMQRVRVTTRQR
jgi:hypothetical protein